MRRSLECPHGKPRRHAQRAGQSERISVQHRHVASRDRKLCCWRGRRQWDLCSKRWQGTTLMVFVATVIWVSHWSFDVIAWCVLATAPLLVRSYYRQSWRIPLWHFFVAIAVVCVECALTGHYLAEWRYYAGRSDMDFHMWTHISTLMSEMLCLGLPIFGLSLLIAVLRRGE